jgi:hypothetical protein
MKKGDIIYRPDMPEVKCRIVGESKKWNAWKVAPLDTELGKIGLIFKDDDRWEIAPNTP